MKKCKVCKTPIPNPFSSTQVVCSGKCAFKFVKRAKDVKFRRETKIMKDNIKTKAQWTREAQIQFNRYIRLRDSRHGCISCGTQAPVQYAAGHYRTIGAHPELRFCLINVHKQCNKNCNMSKSGNILEYRINLVGRIGQDNVDWIEGSHQAKKYTIDELKEIKQGFREWSNEMEKEKSL